MLWYEIPPMLAISTCFSMWSTEYSLGGIFGIFSTAHCPSRSVFSLGFLWGYSMMEFVAFRWTSCLVAIYSWILTVHRPKISWVVFHLCQLLQCEMSKRWRDRGQGRVKLVQITFHDHFSAASVEKSRSSTESSNPAWNGVCSSIWCHSTACSAGEGLSFARPICAKFYIVQV